MRFLLSLSAITLLFMSASAGAWWDNNADRDNRNSHWSNNRYDGRYDGAHDGMGDTSGDASLHGDIQFNMKLRGDAEGYVYGNLGNGWDNVTIEHYSNDANGSNYRRYYKKGGQPDNRRRFYYGPNRGSYYRPYYGPGDATLVPPR